MVSLITKREALLLQHIGEGNVRVSLDLGRTQTSVLVEQGFVCFPEGKVALHLLSKVKEDSCYQITSDGLQKVALYSDESRFYYKLLPTSDWPTFTLSSTPMNRHTKLSPREDTLTKISAIAPISGNVLDTCCGLGYTAIVALQKGASAVYTFERDPYVVALQKMNPYSQELFASPAIHLVEDTVVDHLSDFSDGFFDRVLHDPPTFAYAPELYASEFYEELFRLLKPQGKLYHYCPNPHKLKMSRGQSQGASFAEKISAKLREVGFKNIRYDEKSSGIVAVR